MTKRLLEPILEGGIRHVHFFNGRRLTAEDLQTEQAAGRLERERLGLGVGRGVIAGFDVDEMAERQGENWGFVDGVVLNVSAGMAINGLGQTLALPQDLPVALVAPQRELPADAGLFGPCDGASPVEVGTGQGAYMLVATPVSGFEGRAPMSGFDAAGKVTGCGSRFAVTGVRFAVVPVSLPGGTGNLATLRNRLAHHCFGTQALLSAYRFPPEGPPGDRLAEVAPDLRSCDVPLALLYWSDGRIAFLDHWAVRRRVAASYPASQWLSFTSESRMAVAEAVMLQFQEEIDWLVDHVKGLKSVEAASRFRYLPAAGFLPVGHNEFSVNAFFTRKRFVRQIELEADPAFLRSLVHQSWFVDPIDVNDPPPIVIYHIPGVSDYVFFMRQDASSLNLLTVPDPKEKSAEELDEVTPHVVTGTIEVDLAVADSGQTEWAESLRSAFKRGEKEAEATIVRSLKVTAVDESGAEIEGKLSLYGGVTKVFAEKRFARSVIFPLDPGTYTVSVASRHFRHASKKVDLEEGKTQRLLFQLVPREGGVTKLPGLTLEPNRTMRAKWLQHGWYEKIAVMEAYINPDPLPNLYRYWDPVVDPPREVKDWLVSWADWAAQTLPNAAIDPGEIRLLIRPDYVPDTHSDEPYAFIEFGVRGANVPIVLVPTHTALEGPVSVQSAGVSGIDPDIGMRLWQLGAGELDIAASAWTGLLADAGFTVDTAKSVLADARAKTAYLKTSVRVVPGVDSNIESVLEEKGIDSAVKLANADPARLEQELGIHRKAADIVVQEARKVVGEDSWSLDSPDLGLSKDQVKALEEIGITTKGALAEKSADEISQKIGVAAELAEEMIEKTSRAVDTARLKASVTEKAPISVLKEEEGVQLDAALVKNLADSGLKNVRDVATADVKQLAGLVGDRVKAESLVNAAQKRVGLVR